MPMIGPLGRKIRATLRDAVVVLGGLWFALLTSVGHAQGEAKPASTASSGGAARPANSSKANPGPSWATLKPAQREALKPLERTWDSLDLERKQKWLEIAERYPRMPAQDQARLQTRMAEWSTLTPQERGEARARFQEAKLVSPQDRQASWEAYQALPAEQRRELADRAKPTQRAGSKANGGEMSPESGSRVRDTTQAKSNLVPSPALATPPKPVTPTTVQVQPGATTTLISKTPTPPPHQHAGMPKIVATPEYVNKSTLLPQPGAQDAVVPHAKAPPPAARP
jgi:Protein of unknown function (DUF3106)